MATYRLLAQRMSEDPEFSEGQLKIRRANGSKTASMRRECVDCGMTCSPGNMGRHQSASGHRGFTEVTS